MLCAAPVMTKVEHGDGPFCKSNFTVSFFVPFAEQVRTGYPFFHSFGGACKCQALSPLQQAAQAS
jgi:hypothetical protein